MKRLHKSRGFVGGYLLAAIALAALVAFQLARTSQSNSQGVFNFQNRAVILDQYHLIRARILACGINYPHGDNGTTFRVRYPATGSGFVSDLTCPGQDSSNNLWTGTGGTMLPAVPPAFNPWNYANDATSMRITISARSAGDTQVRGVMDQIVSAVGTNASRSADTLTIVLMN